MDDNDFEIPEDLSPTGKIVAEKILAAAKKAVEGDIDGGGCQAFYSPEEWKLRGESYGQNALLIIVHDGGDLAPFFNYDYEAYALIDRMDNALSELDCYAEQCTSWYSAVYAL